MGRKPSWKTFQIPDMGDLGRLQSTWDSSTQAFGRGKIFDVSRGSADIETNLSFEQLRTLFRHAWVSYPGDGNIVTDTMTTEERVKEWEREESEERKKKQ